MATAKLAPFNISTIDVEGLAIFASGYDLRRDIHVFVEYIRDRRVKRSHRGNQLSKADATRLAKLMSDPEVLTAIQEEGSSPWMDYVDSVALQLGLVQYDTKGRYMGYTSAEPSFPDNYIEFKAKAYEGFLRASLQDQERRLLDTLINAYGYDSNEFFPDSPLGRLDAFERWGSATGVLPHLNFAKARQFLLKVLQHCQSDVWYSMASLIAYLKTEHPFFLIPKNPKQEKGINKGRYGNFYEHQGSRWSNRTTIAETDPDAFERVEGRYVERFLEGIPLSLGYVDVAYGEKQDPEQFPSLGELQAFRVRSHFRPVMAGAIPEPQVTVQPNFEIQVESVFYPAGVLAALRPLASLVTEDRATILKLEKKKVAAQLAENEALDVVELLARLSGRDLPANVLIELEEWTGHSDVFTLYEGFALLEGDAELAAGEANVAESIAPTLRIVKFPEKLFAQLEHAEQVPLLVKHGKRALQPLPKTARTLFPKLAAKAKTAARRKKAVVKRQVLLTLHFPEEVLLAHFRQGLLEARCPIQVDQTLRTITFPQAFERHLKDISKRLSKDYQIQLKDMD